MQIASALAPNSGTVSWGKKDRVLHSKDEDIKAAGVMFLTPNGQVLLVKRSAGGDHAGEWGIPGGKIEDTDENSWSAAWREVKEELGEVPPGQGGMKAANLVKDGVDFTTFFNLVNSPFIPTLDHEHTAFAWTDIMSLPERVHPGVTAVVDGLMDKDDRAGGLLAFIAEDDEELEAEDTSASWKVTWIAFNGDKRSRTFNSLEQAKLFSKGLKEVKILSLSDKAQDTLSFDEGSVRNYDADGRMHVEVTHISKANICPYYGREIPYAESLGLDPDRIYNLYRHPDELAKAAETFNNLPLLSKHVPVSADQHPSDLVIGSTGTDASFNDPFLDNSLVIWTRGGIAAIEEEIQKELSCAYRYEPDMTPGIANGQAYDGVMRNIVGNHVALVKNGRAGSDVVVGDNALPNLKELLMPSATVLSRKAALAKGALIVHLRPKLAADVQIDLTPILVGVNQSNFGEKKASILLNLQKEVKGKLAKDANINDVTGLLDALEDCEELEGEVDGMDSDTPENFLKSKLSAEDKATYDSMCAKDKAMAKDDEDEDKDEKEKKAEDEEDDKDEKKMKKAEDADEDDEEEKKKKKAEDKKAMDSAIEAAVAKVKSDAKATRQAEQACRPYVGELAIACDSADEVYAHTLKALGVDIKDVPPVAYPAILKAQPLPGSKKINTVPAMDSAAMSSFSDRYPEAGRIKSV